MRLASQVHMALALLARALDRAHGRNGWLLAAHLFALGVYSFAPGVHELWRAADVDRRRNRGAAWRQLAPG
jgi:hypothetical protein